MGLATGGLLEQCGDGGLGRSPRGATTGLKMPRALADSLAPELAGHLAVPSFWAEYEYNI